MVPAEGIVVVRLVESGYHYCSCCRCGDKLERNWGVVK
jgi:hypothetical protein